MIQAFSTAGRAPLPAPPTPAAMYRALLRLPGPPGHTGPDAPGYGGGTCGPSLG
jgi:hypothetical protein